MHVRALVVIAALAACQEGERPRAAWHAKPSAPVEVELEARPLGGDLNEVTLTATPTRAVGALALTLDGERLEVGATAAGEPRTMTRQLRGGREVIGVAATERRNRAEIVELGVVPRKPAPPVRIVTMPDGTQIAEVR
jgi:hypothetical protein